MSANVDPEEVEAILEMVGREKSPAVEVHHRDFRTPRRLSPSQLEELEAAFRSCVTPLGDLFSETTGRTCRAHLAGVSEASAEGIVSHLDAHYAVLRFRAAERLGWVVWDVQAALALLDRVFGGSGGDPPEPRHLTRMEGQVLGNLLATVATTVTECLGIEATDFVIVEHEGQIGDWRAGSDRPDAHRLHLALELEGVGDPSELHVYLPGVDAGEGSIVEGLGPGLELPGHLADVQMEIDIRLAECEISLSQLLTLEEGDVIPTSVRSGDPAVILVEGKELATGRLGTHQGRFAVRVEEMTDHAEESP